MHLFWFFPGCKRSLAYDREQRKKRVWRHSPRIFRLYDKRRQPAVIPIQHGRRLVLRCPPRVPRLACDSLLAARRPATRAQHTYLAERRTHVRSFNLIIALLATAICLGSVAPAEGPPDLGIYSQGAEPPASRNCSDESSSVTARTW
jgi:hypothetical protein